jgi:hypothetical protein
MAKHMAPSPAADAVRPGSSNPLLGTSAIAPVQCTGDAGVDSQDGDDTTSHDDAVSLARSAHVGAQHERHASAPGGASKPRLATRCCSH